MSITDTETAKAEAAAAGKASGKMKIIRAATVPMSLDTFCHGMLKELNEKYEVVALSSPGPVLDEVSSREGVKAIGVKMERRMALKEDLRALREIVQVFRKERPRMVHSMTPKAGLLCMLGGWLAGVPVRVHTFTGLVFPTATGWQKRVLMATDWLTCACATHVLPEGQGIKNDLISHHITRKQLEVLGNGNVRGIDLEHFSYTPEVLEASEIWKAEEGVVTFICVGRLVGDKGINELVEAFQLLHKKHENTRLILVGWTEEELDPLRMETVMAIVEGNGIEAVGFQEDVRPWYAVSDVSVLASYREGFPNVVIEAGAMGLPQIVTDINGAREIIIEGVNGTIVPPRSAMALYDAMERMLDNELRKRMAATARQLIADRYEQGYVRRCLYEFYERIMKKK